MLFWIAAALLAMWAVGTLMAFDELVHVLLLVGLMVLLLAFAKGRDTVRPRS